MIVRLKGLEADIYKHSSDDLADLMLVAGALEDSGVLDVRVHLYKEPMEREKNV